MRTLLLLSLSVLVLSGCASNKQTINDGPVPPIRDVMIHFEYLQERLDLTDEQSNKVYQIIEDFNTATAKSLPARGARFSDSGSPPSGPPAGGRGQFRQVRDDIVKHYNVMADRMYEVLTKEQGKEYKRILKELENQRKQQSPQRMRPGQGRRPPSGF